MHSGRNFVVLSILVLCLAVPAAWGDILVTNSGNQSIFEGSTTMVTFTVMNTNNFAVILDYAAAIITVGPVDPSDWTHFAGVNGQAGLNTAALVIPANSPGVFTYNLITDTAVDNNTDPPDSTKNFIDFEAEFSQVGNVGALQNAVLAKLNNLLLLNPNQYPAPLTPYLGPGELLYTGGLQGTPAPSELIVTVFDVPEPSNLGLAGVGLLILCLAGRMRADYWRNSRVYSSSCESLMSVRSPRT